MKEHVKTGLTCIGDTPLLTLPNVTKGLAATVLAKGEFFNPLSSVKDRTALAMVEDAQRRGVLDKETVILEATSGNTGIGLAFVGAQKGNRVVLTMPDSMSLERRKLLQALGAEIVLTPGHLGMNGAIEKANEIAKERGNVFITKQFDNPANVQVHYDTTGPEIWRGACESVDIFVTGVGTGGTIMGVSRFLKEKNPDFQAVAVEPADSAVLSGGEPGPHMIQGIGAGFVPGNVDLSKIDDIIQVSNDEAVEMTRRLAKEEGLLLGISSGANVAAAIRLAKRPENKGKRIVTVLCDGGERYLSTTLFRAEKN